MVKKKIASVKIPEFLLFFFSSVFCLMFFVLIKSPCMGGSLIKQKYYNIVRVLALCKSY